MWLNNYKSAHKSSKTRIQKLFDGRYIQDDHEGNDDWQFTLIDQGTTYERSVGNIVFKCSFQMALMSMNNLLYKTLARQNIFCFINAILSLVVLTYFYY